jgi:hypothetical protein
MASNHKIVSHDEWIEERKKLLAKEKEFNRLRDQLSEQRRALPWERVDKQYTFEGPNGKETLTQLFDGASQLVVYHFMFDPKWDAGCPHCSFWADNFDRIGIHLKHRDISFVAISRAPYVEHRLRGNHVRDVVDHDGRDDDSERDADHSWNHGQHERNGTRRVLHDRLSHRVDRIQRRCDGGEWAFDSAHLLSDSMAIRSGVLAGLTIVGAGLYQLSTLKQNCLRHCCSSKSLLADDQNRSPSAAVRAGLSYGASCFDCCWALMCLLFVVGVMNLYWIAAITICVLAEKTLPWGLRIARVTAVALIGWGSVAIAMGVR